MLPPAFLFSLGSWLSFWTWPLTAPTAAHRPSISDSQLRVKAPQGTWEVWVLHAVMCTVRSYASTPPSRPCLFSQLHFYTSVSVHVLCDWHEGPSGASFISILEALGSQGRSLGTCILGMPGDLTSEECTPLSQKAKSMSSLHLLRFDLLPSHPVP